LHDEGVFSIHHKEKTNTAYIALIGK